MTSNRLSHLILSCGLLLGTVLLTGCQPMAKKEAEVPGPAGPDKVAMMRDSIAKAKPGSLVGQVIYALTDKPYAAVADLPVQDVKVGQTITFLDGDGNPFNNGTVVAIVGDSLHVKFDVSGKRPVQKGDIAVWFKE